jgi:hypothetical protein
MTSPSSAPQCPAVALFGGPLVEGMGKMVSTIFGTTLQPERGARDLVEQFPHLQINSNSNQVSNFA